MPFDDDLRSTGGFGSLPQLMPMDLPGMRPPQQQPTSAQSLQALNQLAPGTKVEIKDSHTRIFDISKPKDNKEYNQLRVTLAKGIPAGTHALIHTERKFVTDDKKARVYIFCEWLDFRVRITEANHE